MTDLRKAAEMALEALESAANNEGNFHDYKYAANALRQALAQPDEIKSAVLAEREACARLVEEVGRQTAAAIRARGDKHD